MIRRLIARFRGRRYFIAFDEANGKHVLGYVDRYGTAHIEKTR